MYYAYQTKKWDLVENIVKTFFIRINSTDYKDFVDFWMMNFYKGLYYIANEVKNNNFRILLLPRFALLLILKLLLMIFFITSRLIPLKDLC
jgi:hypothetical protein